MIKLKRIVIQKDKEFEIEDNQQVYEINLQTGMILLAPLTFAHKKTTGQDVYIINEKGAHLYMPAVSKEQCKIKFNAILTSIKNDKRNNSTPRK